MIDTELDDRPLSEGGEADEGDRKSDLDLALFEDELEEEEDSAVGAQL